jgi:hypothetical protein
MGDDRLKDADKLKRGRSVVQAAFPKPGAAVTPERVTAVVLVRALVASVAMAVAVVVDVVQAEAR